MSPSCMGSSLPALPMPSVTTPMPDTPTFSWVCPAFSLKYKQYQAEISDCARSVSSPTIPHPLSITARSNAKVDSWVIKRNPPLRLLHIDILLQHTGQAHSVILCSSEHCWVDCDYWEPRANNVRRSFYDELKILFQYTVLWEELMVWHLHLINRCSTL